MSITSINTNVNALMAQMQIGSLGDRLQTTMTRLSTGLRLNSGADGPGDLGLAQGMEARLRGLAQATNNAQDSLNLLAFADNALNETNSILQRMNDLAVRASNQAILSSANVAAINVEFENLKTELTRRSSTVAFNGNILFSGGFSSGKSIQVGADNSTSYRLTLNFSQLTLSGLQMKTSGTFFFGMSNLTISNCTTITGGALTQSSYGFALYAIDAIKSAIGIAASVQGAIGVQELKLKYVIDDLNSQSTNLAAAKSRIMDADMAAEISEFTKLQILTQSATAMLAQANLQPQMISKLLGA